MTSMLVAFTLVPIIAAVLVGLNFALAPRHPQYAKQGVVECGMMTLTNQSRQPYSVVFIVVCLLFLAFDLEVVLMWPLALVLSITGLYGFWVIVLFFAVLTLGFVVELASGALRFEQHLETDPLWQSLALVVARLVNGSSSVIMSITG